MARHIAPLLIGLLIGGTAGYTIALVVHGDASPVGGALPVAARSERPREASAPASVETAGSDAPAAAREAEEWSASPRAPETVRASAAAVARGAPPAAQRKGSRTIRGRVLDGDGRPVADVLLRAVHAAEPALPARTEMGRPLPEASLERAMREAADGFYAEQSVRRETTSGADGRYEFTELIDGEWTLAAWRDGLDVRATRRASVHPDATLDFVATPVVPLPLAVLLPDGTPAPRAAVEVRCAGKRDSAETIGWSRDRPSLHVTPGEWKIRATLGDPEHGPPWSDYLASAEATCDVGATGEPPRLELKLVPSPCIRGELRFAAGATRERISVHALRLAPGAAPDLALLAHAPTAREWAADSYCLRDLAPGRWVVGVSHEWSEPIVVHALVDVAPRTVVQDFEIPARDPSHCWFVTARGPDGKRVDDLGFQLTVHDEGGSTTGGVDGEPQPDGSFLVPVDSLRDDTEEPADESALFSASAWPAGIRVVLSVISEQYGHKEVDLIPTAHRVEVAFVPPARVAVTLQGYAGSGLERRVGMRLLARRGDDEPRDDRFFGESSVDDDGTESFGPIEPGDYVLQMWLVGSGLNRWDRRLLSELAVSVVAGDNRVAVPIPALYSLTVETAGEEEPSLVLERVPSQYGTIGGKRDASGRVVFEDLAAGDYLLESNVEGGRMAVTIPCSGVLRFARKTADALLVSIEDEHGRMQQAGFEDGDVLIAVDGKDPADATALRSALSAALARKRVTIALLREGRRVELVLDGTALANPFELGASLSPTAR